MLDRILFVLLRLPRILLIVRELWAISQGSEKEFDDYLAALHEAIGLAKTKEGKREAAMRLSDLIARL